MIRIRAVVVAAALCVGLWGTLAGCSKIQRADYAFEPESEAQRREFCLRIRQDIAAQQQLAAAPPQRDEFATTRMQASRAIDAMNIRWRELHCAGFGPLGDAPAK